MSKKKQKSETAKLSRRGLIAGIGASALTVLIPHTQSQWDFLYDNSYRNQRPDENIIARDYVPVGTESEIDEGDMEEIAAIKAEIIKQAKEKGYDLQKYNVDCVSSAFAVPEQIFAEQLMEYCKSACDFVQSRLTGLKNFEFDWVMPKTGDNYRTNFNGKAFIVDSTLNLAKTIVSDPSTNKELFRFINVRMIKGGKGVFTFARETGKFENRYIFMSTGKAALTSVFSETIGTSTAERFYQDTLKGIENALLTNEALHEGIAFVLAEDFARIRNIPEGQMIIDSTRATLLKDRPYVYLNQGINWVRKNGVQNAYDLYMENPQKFLDAIRR